MNARKCSSGWIPPSEWVSTLEIRGRCPAHVRGDKLVKATTLRRRTRWQVAGAVVLALSVLACTGADNGGLRGRVSAQSASEQTAAATPDDVVRLVVEADGKTYAGDCAATRSPQDVGKTCSKLIEERNGVRAYLTGRTFSEFSTWIFVEQTTSGWLAAGTTPLDFSATSMEIPWPK